MEIIQPWSIKDIRSGTISLALRNRVHLYYSEEELRKMRGYKPIIAASGVGGPLETPLGKYLLILQGWEFMSSQILSPKTSIDCNLNGWDPLSMDPWW